MNIYKFCLLFFVKTDSCRTSLPDVCLYYSKKGGCRKRDDCSRLHICKYYIRGDCKHGERCQKSHDISDSQPEKVIQNSGVKIDSVEKFLDDLKQKMLSKSSASKVGRPPSNQGSIGKYLHQKRTKISHLLTTVCFLFSQNVV